LFLISAGGGNSVYLWDLLEERVVSSFSNLGGLVSSIAFSEDDQQIVIGLNNGSIKVFALPAKEDYSKAKSPLVTLTGFVEGPRSISFSRDGKLIVAGNHLDGLKIWDAGTGDEVFALDGHMRGVDSLYFSSDGIWLATAHNDRKVRIWKLQDAEAKYEFEGYLPQGKPFSLDNRYLTVIQAATDNYRLDNVQIVELSSGKVVATLPEYAAGSLVQFTEDSKLLIVGDNHAANIWDVSTWERLDTHGGMNAGCGQYFTPENRRVAVIYEAGVLFSYDKKIQDMCGTKPAGTTLVYYFESAHMAFFVLGDGRLWSWDFLSSDIANIRSGNPFPFSNDIFLTADQKSGWYAYVADAKLLIRELRSTRPSKTIDDQSDYLYRVALLPDQKLMALGSQYGSIHIWTMP
jgi:WD40 repeat protein